MDRYTEESLILEGQLKPRLTKEWLETLVDAGRTCGWMVDYHEVVNFIHWCHEVAEAQYPPTLEPFQSPGGE